MDIAARSKGIDVLRAIAVLLVIAYHAGVPVLRNAGWSGVDLFFVLSGFLVSGLLFSENKTFGKIRVGRFLIRRGFKIYPAFYLMLGVTALARFLVWHVDIFGPAWHEALFLQSYLPGL